MTALVARVQGLGTRARRWTLWRQVVRRDSAVQEGLHEHTLDANHLEAGILTPRDRRRLTRSWNDNDFNGLHCRLHCVPLHRDGYELQPLLHPLHNIHPQQALPTPFRYITPTPCAFASSGCSQFSQRKRQVFEPLPSADFSNSLANCHWRLYLVRDQPSSFPPPSSSTSSSL